MNNSFEDKLRAAVVAGWWTVAVGYAMVILSWLMYLVVMSTHPAWFQSLWGPDISWSYIQNVWMCGLVAFKLSVWLLIMVVLWLTLWARRLRKG